MGGLSGGSCRRDCPRKLEVVEEARTSLGHNVKIDIAPRGSRECLRHNATAIAVARLTASLQLLESVILLWVEIWVTRRQVPSTNV